MLRLGAQRGYETAMETFDGTQGVIGRVMRTGESALVRDVADDPDYAVAESGVQSEIAVPLIAGGELLGVLNVEDARVGGLDESDRSTLILIAERLAGAIALGREREAIAQRAALFQALAELSRTVNVSLEPAKLYPVIVDAVATVMRSDLVVLTVLDPARRRLPDRGHARRGPALRRRSDPGGGRAVGPGHRRGTTRSSSRGSRATASPRRSRARRPRTR